MKPLGLPVARMACAYFFICPGLAYGIFTSRLPALKIQTGVNEAQIGLLLLCLGLSSIGALVSSTWLIARWGSRQILTVSSLCLAGSVIVCCMARSPVQLGAGCLLTGISMGLVDVSINTQGIQIEKRYLSSCMSFMHASYSLGGVIGSLSGAVFAGLGFSPLVNAVCVLGFYSCFRLWAVPGLLDDLPAVPNNKKKTSQAFPPFVVFCGLLAMLAYAAEGSVAEWGSLLLFTEKGASEQTAALVFGSFSLTTVFCRFLGDRLRNIAGDFVLLFCGSLMAFTGMVLVLFSVSLLSVLRGMPLWEQVFLHWFPSCSAAPEVYRESVPAGRVLLYPYWPTADYCFSLRCSDSLRMKKDCPEHCL